MPELVFNVFVNGKKISVRVEESDVENRNVSNCKEVRSFSNMADSCIDWQNMTLFGRLDSN